MVEEDGSAAFIVRARLERCSRVTSAGHLESDHCFTVSALNYRAAHKIRDNNK